jgi:cytoskeletal protein RodZ
MSRHNHKCHYGHSSLLVLAIVVSYSLLLVFFLSNDIYAQNESNIISPQEPNQVGEQGQTFQNVTSNNDNPLIMTTDQNIYSPGETVNITMTNTGEEPLTFPNSALGLMIRNLATNESYPIYSAQVITTLNPNESSSVIWDTVASNGNPVPLGDYIASVRSGSSTTNVIFSIVKQIP